VAEREVSWIAVLAVQTDDRDSQRGGSLANAVSETGGDEEQSDAGAGVGCGGLERPLRQGPVVRFHRDVDDYPIGKLRARG